ncbi:hypothetical protein KW429_11445 [Vibrio fluvialis]|nr:hypothetical protein [Vibrio fluvialis]
MIIDAHEYQSDISQIADRFDISASQLKKWAVNRPLTAAMFDLANLALVANIPEATAVFSKNFGTDHRELGAIVGFNDNIYYMGGICPIVGTTLRTWSSTPSKWVMFCGAILGTHCLVFEQLASKVEASLPDILSKVGLSRADAVALYLARPSATVALCNAIATHEQNSSVK